MSRTDTASYPGRTKSFCILRVRFVKRSKSAACRGLGDAHKQLNPVSDFEIIETHLILHTKRVEIRLVFIQGFAYLFGKLCGVGSLPNFCCKPEGWISHPFVQFVSWRMSRWIMSFFVVYGWSGCDSLSGFFPRLLLKRCSIMLS